MFLLILDSRENKLVELFRSYHTKDSPFIFKVAQLDIGDIIIANIKTVEGVNEKSKITNLITFERKTMNDLVVSIKDGRYKEQKARLSAYLKQNKTYKIQYILEGDTIMYNDNQKKQIWGSWVSMLYRDNIDVIRTISIRETYNFLIRLIDRLHKDGADFIKDGIISNNKNVNISNESPEYVEGNNNSSTNNTNIVKSVEIDYLGTLKAKKKSNYTPKVCQILSIGTIPGISNKTAELVINYYGSLNNLMKAYIQIDNTISDLEERQKKKEQMLVNIINPLTKRKIGVASSKKIYEYLIT